MSFNVDELERRVAAAGRVARIVVANTRGSTPREIGASMLVWSEGDSGTIGGGALELQAIAAARSLLDGKSDSSESRRISLGPGLGQCCGGAVTLLTEIFDRVALDEAKKDVARTGCFARHVERSGTDPPTAAERALRRINDSPSNTRPKLIAGWLIEPVCSPARYVWLYGAGHVGRAIADVLGPLPGFRTTWIDVAMKRFPQNCPPNAEISVEQNPVDGVNCAPEAADHLILTFSHALDLEICGKLLERPFRSAGLIGSDTKWARFRKRLVELGHPESLVDRIKCPIGNPALGKHPRAIAIGVAASLLAESGTWPQTGETGH